MIGFFLKVKDFLKGKKTYIAAAVLLLQALLGYVDQLLALGGIGQFGEWIFSLPANGSTVMLAEALALFGIRAAISRKL